MLGAENSRPLFIQNYKIQHKTYTEEDQALATSVLLFPEFPIFAFQT